MVDNSFNNQLTTVAYSGGKIFILLIVLLAINSALSHGESNAYHRLQGSKLCLDSRSVTVAIDLGEEDIDTEGLVGELEPALKSYITKTLETTLIPFKEVKNCPEDTLLQSLFDIRPSGYAGDPTVVFSALTHVGSDVSTQETSNEDNSIYYSFNTSLEFIEDFPDATDFNIDTNKAMILELIQNWWEDNPETQATKQPSRLPQILGISLSLMILIIGLYLIKR